MNDREPGAPLFRPRRHDVFWSLGAGRAAGGSA